MNSIILCPSLQLLRPTMQDPGKCMPRPCRVSSLSTPIIVGSPLLALFPSHILICIPSLRWRLYATNGLFCGHCLLSYVTDYGITLECWLHGISHSLRTRLMGALAPRRGVVDASSYSFYPSMAGKCQSWWACNIQKCQSQRRFGSLYRAPIQRPKSFLCRIRPINLRC